jgi:hypothetical protein
MNFLLEEPQDWLNSQWGGGGGLGAALKDHITGYCPEARGHGLRIGGIARVILLFPC